MTQIRRVGTDLAKRVIQLHAVDAPGKLVTNRALAREPFEPMALAAIPDSLHSSDSGLKRVLSGRERIVGLTA